MSDTGTDVFDNEWEMICPGCGSDERLDIQARIWVRLFPDGTDADQAHDGSHEWDKDSLCHCAACGWTGTVGQAEAAYEAKNNDGASHLLDHVVVGTQVMSILGELGHNAKGIQCHTGPEARGHVDLIEPNSMDLPYTVVFPATGHVIRLSAVELGDESRYLLADPGERT